MNITKAFKRVLAGAAIACALVAAAPAPALASTSKAVPVYRIYNPNSGEHMFMTSQTEVNAVVKAGWTLEGVAWYAPSKDAPNAKPLYRVYNPNANGGDHHYTTSRDEYRSLINAGWHDEHVAFYVNGNLSTISVYRAYNPTPNVAGSHHFTVSWDEVGDIVKVGWRNEGMAFKVINTLDVNKSIVNGANAFVKNYPDGRYPSGLGDGGAEVLPAPNNGNNSSNNNSGNNATTPKPSQTNSGSSGTTKRSYHETSRTIKSTDTVALQPIADSFGAGKITTVSYQSGERLQISGTTAKVPTTYYTDSSTYWLYTDKAIVCVNFKIIKATTNASGQTITVQNAPDYVTTLHGKSVKLTEQGKRQWVAHNGRTVVGFDFDGSKGYGLDFKSFSENVYGKVTYFNDPKTHVPYQYNRGSAWGACSIEGVSTSFNYQSMIFEHANEVDFGRMTIPNRGIFDTHSKAADQAFADYLEEQAVANQASYWDITESYGISKLQYRYTNNIVTRERRVDYTIADDCGGDYYEYIRRMLLPYNDHMSPTWILCQRWYEVADDANSSITAIKRQNRYWCVWQDQLH